DVTVGHLADVNQSAVFQADVDKGAEVDDVENGALQLHAGLEVFELQHTLLEDGGRQIVARIAPWTRQGFEDVAQGRCPDVEPGRDLFRRERLYLFPQFGGSRAAGDHFGAGAQPAAHVADARIAVPADRRLVDSAVPAGDLDAAG